MFNAILQGMFNWWSSYKMTACIYTYNIISIIIYMDSAANWDISQLSSAINYIH